MNAVITKVILITLTVLLVGNSSANAQQGNQTVVGEPNFEENTAYPEQDEEESNIIQLFPTQSFLQDGVESDGATTDNSTLPANSYNADAKAPAVGNDENYFSVPTPRDAQGNLLAPGFDLQKQLNQNQSVPQGTPQPPDKTNIQRITTQNTAEGGFWQLIAQTEIVSTLIIIGLVFVLGYFFYSYLRSRKTFQDELVQHRLERNSLEHEMSYYQMLIEADNEVKLVYDNDDNVFMFGRSDRELAIPEEVDKIEDFHNWLTRNSAGRLLKYLQELRSTGEEFIVNLETSNNSIIEAEGRLMSNMCCGLWLRRLPEEKRKVNQLKKQMQAQSHMLQALTETTSKLNVAVWIRDNNGKIIWTNESYAKIFAEDMTVKNVVEKQIELMPDDEIIKAVNKINKNEVYNKTIKFNKNGEERIYQAIAVANDKGGSFSAAADVTELHNVSSNIEINNNMNDEILNNLQASMMIFGDDNRLLFANDMFVELTGIERKWLEEKPYANEIFDKMREKNCLPEQKDYHNWLTPWLDAHTKGEIYEDQWYLQDGRKLNVKKIVQFTKGITFIIDDITQSLELSGQVDALTDLQTETLDNLREAVVQFGADGRVKLCNKLFRKMFLEGMNFNKEPHINDIAVNSKSNISDIQHFEAIKQIVLNMEPQGERKGMINFKDGRIYSFNARFVNGGTRLVTYDDQTDAIRYQQVLKENNEALEKTSVMKKEFMAQVSQKLREPLNALMAYSQMLDVGMHGSLNPEQANLVKLMANQFNTLKALVDTIIDKAQIDAGAVRLKLRLSPVKTLVDCAVKGVVGKLRKKDITLKLNIPDKEVNIIVDPVNLTKIITSLLSDAIDYSAQGNAIALKCFEDDKGMCFDITDTCPFVSEETRRSVPDFEIEPKDASLRMQSLSYQIASGLVRMHGGSIKMQPFGKSGTIVSFVIPLPKSGNLQKAS